MFHVSTRYPLVCYSQLFTHFLYFVCILPKPNNTCCFGHNVTFWRSQPACEISGLRTHSSGLFVASIFMFIFISVAIHNKCILNQSNLFCYSLSLDSFYNSFSYSIQFMFFYENWICTTESSKWTLNLPFCRRRRDSGVLRTGFSGRCSGTHWRTLGNKPHFVVPVEHLHRTATQTITMCYQIWVWRFTESSKIWK